MKQPTIKFKDRCTSTVIREEIIFLLNRGKLLLITPLLYRNLLVLRSVMKRTVQDYYMQRLLQGIIWKTFLTCVSLLMYRIGAMCMKVYWMIRKKQWI